MLLLLLTAREGPLSSKRQRCVQPAKCRAASQIAARGRGRVPLRQRRRSPRRQNRRKRRSFKPALTPIEKHFKIKYVQDRLSMSYERARQLVMFEPGVVVLPSEKPCLEVVDFIVVEAGGVEPSPAVSTFEVAASGPAGELRRRDCVPGGRWLHYCTIVLCRYARWRIDIHNRIAP